MKPTKAQKLKLMGDFLSLAIWELSPEEICSFKAIHNLITRADDYERLVEAAKEIDVCSFEEDGTVSRAYWKLHKARTPFMEKDRGDVPVISEEGFSNEEEP